MKSHHDDYRDIADILHEAKMHKKYPWVNNALKNLWHHQDPRLLQTILKEQPLLLDEAKTRIRALKEAKNDFPIEVPYKPHHLADLKGSPSALDIGIIGYHRETFGIDINDLCKNLLVLGAPGMGKTTLIRNLLTHIMQTSPQERGFNVICFDTKGDYHPLLKHHPETFYLNHKSIRHNFFEPIRGDDELSHMITATEILCEENYFKAMAQPLVQQSLTAAIKKSGILRGSTQYPTISDILDDLNRIMRDKKTKEVIKGRDVTDVISKINIRLGQYVSLYGHAFNVKKGYPLDFWLDNDIIINTAGMNEYIIRHFPIDLMYRIYDYLLFNNHKGQNLKTLFIFDEGRYMFDPERDFNIYQSNQFIEDLLLRGRELGLGFIIGAQQSDLICQTVRNNCSYQLLFKVNPNSFENEARQLGLDEIEAKYISHLRVGKAIARSPHYPYPFQTDIPFQNFDKSMTPKEALKLTEPRIQAILNQMSQDEQEKEGERIITALERHPELAAILMQLNNNPFSHETALLKSSKLQKPQFDSAMKALRLYGFLAEPIRCRSGQRSWAMFHPLTPTAQDYLGINSKHQIHPKRFKHSYYQTVVASTLTRQGHAAQTEYTPSGAQHLGRIDVAYLDKKGLLHAFEITLSHSSFLENVQKCHAAGAARITIVCEDKKSTGRFQSKGNKEIEQDILGKVRFTSMTEFL